MRAVDAGYATFEHLEYQLEIPKTCSDGQLVVLTYRSAFKCEGTYQPGASIVILRGPRQHRVVCKYSMRREYMLYPGANHKNAILPKERSAGAWRATPPPPSVQSTTPWTDA
jgi:hypothetical protein